MFPQVENFLQRYKQFAAAMQVELIAEKKVAFSNLLEGYRTLLPALRHLQASEAVQFNVFSIMKLRHSEVRVHTPFVCELLNLNGSHAQGDLFYRSLIERFFPGNVFLLGYDKTKFFIKDELSTAHGQIDIFIRSSTPQANYAIVIENKIYAGDQKEQLVRYKKYMDSIVNLQDHAKLLIYLTLSGTDPSEFSVENKMYDYWQQQGIIQCLSYKKDILPWLEDCLPEVKASVVAFAIQQYISLIKSL